jgi:hypothetical protein
MLDVPPEIDTVVGCVTVLVTVPPESVVVANWVVVETVVIVGVVVAVTVAIPDVMVRTVTSVKVTVPPFFELV